MFRRISYTIALQFMAFVFLLFIINGAIFLAADFVNARRQMGMRLAQTAQFVIEQTSIGPAGITVSLPRMMREQVRVVDLQGQAVFTGGFFEEIPFQKQTGMSILRYDREQYAVLTAAIERDQQLIGYLQIADIIRQPVGDLPLRAGIYLLVSAAISALTFGVGLFFARRSLKPAEQMVEKLEQFTQDASHELRTPLAVLNSSLDLALKTENYRDGIVSAKSDVKQIAMLVEKLLELTRLDSTVFIKEAVDLSALTLDTVERQRALASEKNIMIETTVQPDVIVSGDPSLIRQIISNILSNAIKFSKPEGGTISLTLTKTVLTIRDTGVGIAPEDVRQIFDRFYQVDESRAKGGYGLGLALVKRIVDLHGWQISAKSQRGKGTTFAIRLTSQR